MKIRHVPQVARRKPAHAHELRLQVAGQGFDHAFAPALLLALGDEAAQVPVELHLLLVDLSQGAVLGLAYPLLHGGQQLVVVGRGWVHSGKVHAAFELMMPGVGRKQAGRNRPPVSLYFPPRLPPR